MPHNHVSNLFVGGVEVGCEDITAYINTFLSFASLISVYHINPKLANRHISHKQGVVKIVLNFCCCFLIIEDCFTVIFCLFLS
jgi:hypothetical protein